MLKEKKEENKMENKKNEQQKLRSFIINEIQLINVINLLKNSNFANITYSQLENFLQSLSNLPEHKQEQKKENIQEEKKKEN